MNNGTKVALLVSAVVLFTGIGIAISGGDNSNTSVSNTSNSTTSESSTEKSFRTAIQKLKSNESKPIQEINISGNKIIYYGDEILVQISYKVASLTSSVGDYYTATYSVTNDEFYNKIRLSNMMYTDEWKSAKIETIDSKTIDKINKEFFK